MLQENLHRFRPSDEMIRDKDIIARQRHFRTFNLECHQPARLSKDRHWRERSNPSGITLSHYLRIKNSQLRRLYHVIELEADGLARYPECDPGQLTEWVRLYDRIFDCYVEDWGIYVQPEGDFFIAHIQNRADRAFENMDRNEALEATISDIFDRRDFPWVRFEPMDYAETQSALVELCSLSLQNRAELRLKRRKTLPWPRLNTHDHNLRKADFRRLEEIRLLRDYSHQLPIAIDSDYLRDILRFESLFFISDDPLDDNYWHSCRLDGPWAVSKIIDDARAGLPPLLQTLPV